MVFCAMLKCTKPANGQKETENNYNAPSKSISDLSPLLALDDNNCSQTGHHEFTDHQPNNTSVTQLSSTSNSREALVDEDALKEKNNSDQTTKNNFWTERSISFPSPSKFYLNKNKTDDEDDLKEHESTKDSIRIKLKSLQSRYSIKTFTFNDNENQSEAKSELSKDGKTEKDGSADDNTTTSDDEEEVTKSHLAEFRDRIQTCASGWILLLSIPPLVMLAHLQNLINVPEFAGGGSGKSKPPSIQPNDYMDSLLEDVKASMKERGLHHLELPDHQQNGITFYKGQVRGITNLSRQGDAKLEAATDHFLFIFTLQAKNIEAEYFWKKHRLKGEVTASVKRIVMTMEVKQKLPTNESHPKLTEFKVTELDDIRVKMQGLGQPLNWVVRKILCRLLQRYLRETLEREAKPIIQQELNNVKESDLIALPLGLSSISSMIPDSIIPSS